MKCTHTHLIQPVTPSSKVCEDCVKVGGAWEHLRLCRICGYVGCSDDSKNAHAAQHAREAAHPIVRSLEPGENWSWCYVDKIHLDDTEITADDGGENQEARFVIRRYISLASLYTLSASLIWGVNTLFLLDAGLDILSVFIANAVFTGSMAVFEIPTGVLADTRGRRTSFLISLFVLFLGTLGYVGVAAVGGGLALFSLMSVVLGLGYTFYSGAMEAWLVDALKATGYRGQLDHIFATSSIATGIAMLVGTIGGGLLGQIDLALPFLARAGLIALVFGIAYFGMHDLGFSPRDVNMREMPGEMRRIARASITYGWHQGAVRLLILGFFVQSIFSAWGFHAWQPHFLELLGRDLPWVAGVIAALVALATIGGNALVEWLTRYCGKRTTLLLWAAGVQSVAVVGVGLANSFWLAVGSYLVGMAAAGVWGPVRQAYMHQIIPSEQRATVISFDSLVASGGSVIGQSGLGYLARVRSLSSGYLTGGLVTLLSIPIILALRGRGDAEDQIVGMAGRRGACAAQGLPNATAVDTAVQP